MLVYAGSPKYLEYTYDAARRVWNLMPGFPVSVPRRSGSETMVLEEDSAGRAWVTTEGNNEIEVYYTRSSDHRTGSKTPMVLRSGVDSDDISSLVAFGGDKVGAFWSDQRRDEFGFCVHRDADPPAATGPRPGDERRAFGHPCPRFGIRIDSSRMGWGFRARDTICPARGRRVSPRTTRFAPARGASPPREGERHLAGSITHSSR